MDLSIVTGAAPREAHRSNGSPENPSSGTGRGNSYYEEYPSHQENGRLYHGFRRTMYPYPCDELEQNRLDIFHKVFSVARFDRLHYAPLPNTLPSNQSNDSSAKQPIDPGPRILDLGCGTGIWAIDMARLYPNAYVLGIDLSPIQPQNRPDNCDFQAPRDFESPWLLGEDSWDLIHLQMGCGSVASWPNLYRKVFQHLRPGTGYFEQVEIDLEPRPDRYMAPDQPLSQWYRSLKDATEIGGKPIAFNRNILYMLREAGFEDITHQIVGLPLNPWPTDKHEKEVGKWYNLAYSESAHTLLLGPLSRVNNTPLEEIDALAKAAKSQAYNKHVEAYNLLHIIMARKPGPAPSEPQGIPHR
ncbi:hypothetical protein AJ80_00046 [Polytolypa hystricis UAMH7299]|uniref:Velvet complex subunit laeA n=1 Tax=Polytolypa hystricis (strain UAMH7299) TaxID=1447883 RepID=A0A2B7Z2L0_POLH7|nr:hypothetical protein AJ80_00046 [Polytolypa hystricis UAMH7299]